MNKRNTRIQEANKPPLTRWLLSTLPILKPLWDVWYIFTLVNTCLAIITFGFGYLPLLMMPILAGCWWVTALMVVSLIEIMVWEDES